MYAYTVCSVCLFFNASIISVPNVSIFLFHVEISSLMSDVAWHDRLTAATGITAGFIRRSIPLILLSPTSHSRILIHCKWRERTQKKNPCVAAVSL